MFFQVFIGFQMSTTLQFYTRHLSNSQRSGGLQNLYTRPFHKFSESLSFTTLFDYDISYLIYLV